MSDTIVLFRHGDASPLGERDLSREAQARIAATVRSLDTILATDSSGWLVLGGHGPLAKATAAFVHHLRPRAMISQSNLLISRTIRELWLQSSGRHAVLLVCTTGEHISSLCDQAGIFLSCFDDEGNRKLARGSALVLRTIDAGQLHPVHIQGNAIQTCHRGSPSAAHLWRDEDPDFVA